MQPSEDAPSTYKSLPGGLRISVSRSAYADSGELGCIYDSSSIGLDLLSNILFQSMVLIHGVKIPKAQ